MSLYNQLEEGQRFWCIERPVTLVRKDYDFDDNSRWSTNVTCNYTLEYNDRQGGWLTLSDYEAVVLLEGRVYAPNSGFLVGDTMEIKRDGLEPNIRGRLLEIDEQAERWPYRVGHDNGPSVWFSLGELTKIHSVTSRERSPRALEVLKKRITEAREELEALETALEVLEYAAT